MPGITPGFPDAPVIAGGAQYFGPSSWAVLWLCFWIICRRYLYFWVLGDFGTCYLDPLIEKNLIFFYNIRQGCGSPCLVRQDFEGFFPTAECFGVFSHSKGFGADRSSSKNPFPQGSRLKVPK